MPILYILGGLAALFLLYILFLTFCSIPVSTKKEYNTHSGFYRFLLDSATFCAVKLLRIRVSVTGQDKLPAEGRFLLVSNHISNFDPILTWYALPSYKLAFVSKPSNFKIPWFGRIIRKCCFMAIDRENPRNAIRTINRAAELIKNDQVSIGIYPEGTRSKTGELLPFHNGVFKIAQKANVPIVVAGLSGTETIRKQTPLRTSRVYLDILEVIPAETVCSTKTDQLGQQVRTLLEENSAKRQSNLNNKERL